MRALHVVVHEVSVGHVNELFSVKSRNAVGRARYFICHHVVNVVSTHGPTKTHVLDLNRSRPEHEHILSVAASPSIQVEKNVDILVVNEL